MPTYPGPWATPCPGGNRTFVQGIADVAEESKLHMVDEPVRGDLDENLDEEVVVKLVCSTEGASDGNPLLVRVEPDGRITTIGWVNLDADGDLLVMDPAEPIEFAAGRIRVVVIGRYGDLPQNLDKEAFAFAVRDNRIVMTGGGPFLPGTTDASAVDLRNTTLFLATNDGTGAGGSVNSYLRLRAYRRGPGHGQL